MKRIAGVDEAGRGPLAGPVVVAAVVLDPARPIAGLNDSKQLSEARRHALDAEIRARALAFCVIEVGTEAIDRHNILQATLIGMRDALLGLAPAPDEALIDGNKLPKDLPCAARAIVDGDAGTLDIIAILKKAFAFVLQKREQQELQRKRQLRRESQVHETDIGRVRQMMPSA